MIRIELLKSRALGAALCVSTGIASAAAAGDNPFATGVVSYDAGTGANPVYADPATALGSPERFTGEGVFPGSVTPFAPAFGTDEIVSIGAGGSLTLAFDHDVVDDPTNPFGIDLLVFGNSFFLADDFTSPDPRVTGLASDGGLIEVSADGEHFVTVPGVEADGLFPTLGYADETMPFGGPAGMVETDFTRPVDPTLDPTGLSFTELITAYDGSGGGAGIDLATTGLSAIRFVRISLPIDATGTIEIDAVSDVAIVPAPGGIAALLLAGGLGGAMARRRRAVTVGWQS